MSLQLIIAHKRKQINHFPCIVMGGMDEARRERRRGVEMWHERKLVSPWALFTTTTLCQGFSWGTLVLIKTGPILNSNPLAWLASSGNALSNHWNRWMFLHYHGWTISINRVQSFLMPGLGWNSQHTFSVNNAAVCYESPCQFLAKKVVSRTFWPYVPLQLWDYLTSWINHLFFLNDFAFCVVYFLFLAWYKYI